MVLGGFRSFHVLVTTKAKHLQYGMNWNQVIMEIIDFWGVPLVLLKIILITFLNFTESFQPHKKWSYIITEENKQQVFKFNSLLGNFSS